MQYIEYKVLCIPDEDSSDIIVAELADLGFESFSEYDAAGQSISGYLPVKEAPQHEPEIEIYLKEAGYPYQRNEMEDNTNWNSVWESQFDPILLDGRCHIRAPFHEPRTDVEHEIVIMPKMSFGTGHHATTSLILARMMDLNLSEKTGLDMGSGTGVLAILAAMRGASHVDAIDIDNWAYENCLENIRMNGVEKQISVYEGDASLLGTEPKYDFILANINRNILLADMEHYTRVLKPDEIILFSGFLEIDIPAIEKRAKELGLAPQDTVLKNGWAMVMCKKEG